jgi:hypothetical protein
MHLFEKTLSVSMDEVEFVLRGIRDISWPDFLLNPRRLRGSDFLMRWSQGSWSEMRLLDAVNKTGDFYAVPYGPSGTAPSEDVRAFELYFEELEAAGLGKVKRPDLLIFKSRDKEFAHNFVERLGGIARLPFTPDDRLIPLVSRAILAVECETSLWKAEKMPDYGKPMRKQRRLGGKIGLAANAVLPTVIIKEEDRLPLLEWQDGFSVPIHIWHVFFDRAYGLALNTAQALLDEGLILPTVQTFQAPGGATTKKAIYKFYYHYAYPLGHAGEQPQLLAAFVEDKNGHILPYVRFSGGMLTLTDEALKELYKLCPSS